MCFHNWARSAVRILVLNVLALNMIALNMPTLNMRALEHACTEHACTRTQNPTLGIFVTYLEREREQKKKSNRI